MRKAIVGSSALALVLTAGFFAASAVGGAPRRAGVAASTTTSTPTSTPTSTSTPTAPAKPTTTVAPTTTTTVKPKPVDPLAGAVALGVHARSIDALDNNGKVIKHLVTVFADRQVREAHLMGDHHTIWYLTVPTMENATPQTNRCSDVVRLDLATNRRTVVAHAQTFAVSANGNRVALEEVEPDIACTDTTKFVVGVNVVRDVSSGRQSAIVGDFEGSIAMSPGGHVLLATHCATDDYNEDCPATLESAAVPDSLGAPVTLHDVNTHGSFTSLVARNDGLYAIVDTMQRDCGCAGAPQDRTDSAVSVRRLSWSALAGTGATVFTVHGPLQLDGLAVTPNGLYATGLASVKADRAVFHLGANGAQLLRLVPDPEAAFDFLGTIDAFAG